MARMESVERLLRIGITWDDALALRRISMTLHRWHELECGCDGGAIERDEKTNKVYWWNPDSQNGRRYPFPDRETGALKRLDKIMGKYQGYAHYVQGDPRGAALYILSPDTLARYKITPETIDGNYSQGVAVYK